jgi:hypothetical protein
VTSFILLAQTDANNGAAAGGVIGGLLALGAVFWIIAILASIFWLWMLVDVLMSNKPANEKILWFLVVFFLHLIGALIYFFVGRNRTPGTVTGPGTV